jgi:hypothetical protein
MKLMHGLIERGFGVSRHAICTEDGKPLAMTAENVEKLVARWNEAEEPVARLVGGNWVQVPRSYFDELQERIEMLNHVALSAIALKMNIENGFPPTLHALNRDLALFQVRFGGVVEMAGKAAVAMEEQNSK